MILVYLLNLRFVKEITPLNKNNFWNIKNISKQNNKNNRLKLKIHKIVTKYDNCKIFYLFKYFYIYFKYFSPEMMLCSYFEKRKYVALEITDPLI